MSVFSRLTDVINANLHSLLDKSEEPEKMLRLMIEEMEQVQIEMRTQAARVIAEQKQLERHQQALQHQILEWSAKAELAIQKGREDLARAALTEKLAEVKNVNSWSRTRPGWPRCWPSSPPTASGWRPS